MEFTVPKATAWPRGANNLTPNDRVPEGHFRSAVNLEPVPGGALALRCGFEKVLETANLRACFSHRSAVVVVVDEDQLLAFDTRTSTVTALTTVAGAGAVAGASLNDVLYLSTPTDSLRLDSGVKPWAVPSPGYEVYLVAGSLAAGTYKVAVTAYGADGEESGVIPMTIPVPAGYTLRVVSPDSRPLRVYVSAVNGETLYSQGPMFGTYLVGQPDDSGARLTTAHMVPMPPCSILVPHHATLVGCQGRAVYVTEPMRPHLVDPIRGFFQFATPVTMLAATDGGVYVAADKTWFLTGLETAEPAQRLVADHGAVPGTGTPLPDGRVAWFTEYGQAIGNSAGQVEFVNKDSYAPDTAAIGAAGLLKHNGNQTVVTTMRGATEANRMAAGDFCQVEITDERKYGGD